jgi:hypothetical protein
MAEQTQRAMNFKTPLESAHIRMHNKFPKMTIEGMYKDIHDGFAVHKFGWLDFAMNATACYGGMPLSEVKALYINLNLPDCEPIPE